MDFHLLTALLGFFLSLKELKILTIFWVVSVDISVKVKKPCYPYRSNKDFMSVECSIVQQGCSLREAQTLHEWLNNEQAFMPPLLLHRTPPFLPLCTQHVKHSFLWTLHDVFVLLNAGMVEVEKQMIKQTQDLQDLHSIYTFIHRKKIKSN